MGARSSRVVVDLAARCAWCSPSASATSASTPPARGSVRLALTVSASSGPVASTVPDNTSGRPSSAGHQLGELREVDRRRRRVDDDRAALPRRPPAAGRTKLASRALAAVRRCRSRTSWRPSCAVQWPDSSATRSAGCAASNVARRIARSVRPRASVRPKSPSSPSTRAGHRGPSDAAVASSMATVPCSITSEGSSTGCAFGESLRRGRSRLAMCHPAASWIRTIDGRVSVISGNTPVARQQLADAVGHAHALDAHHFAAVLRDADVGERRAVPEIAVEPPDRQLPVEEPRGLPFAESPRPVAEPGRLRRDERARDEERHAPARGRRGS